MNKQTDTVADSYTGKAATESIAKDTDTGETTDRDTFTGAATDTDTVSYGYRYTHSHSYSYINNHRYNASGVLDASLQFPNTFQ